MTGSLASCGGFVPPCPAGRDVQRPPAPFAGGGVQRAERADPRGAGAVGQAPPKEPCCSLIFGLVDLNAAACIFLAISANVLGVNLTLLPCCCGCKAPKGSRCV
ncbi:hypothetical protein VPH35_079588 [Triticum aestivum]|nr:putative lipid-binding protein AIR1B [Aegilops tauschii subsp. strangulata]